jgi:hypothetical protein
MRDRNRKNRIAKGATATPTATPATPTSTNGGKVSVTNTASLDAEQPIPHEYNSQVFISRKGVQYIPFLNPTDNFAQLLVEAKMLSPTNKSCVGSKSEFCLGTGVMFKDVDKVEGFDDFARSVNRKGQSLNEIIKGGFNSFFTGGNAYLEIVRGEILGTRVMAIYKRNLLDCRLALPDDDDMAVSVIVSKEFRERGIWDMSMDKVTNIPIYSTNMFDNVWWRDSRGFEHTMIHLKNEEEGYDYYGMPSNIASLPQQILEYKAARANIDNFDNNLVLGGTILLKGNVTPAEAKKIGKQIVYQHSGDGKRGRFAILYSENGALQDTKIDQFQKERDGDFIELDKHIEDKIVSANQWDPLLAGMHKSSGIGSGGTAYIRSIFDIKNESVIKPAQAFMVDKFLKPLMFIIDDFMGTSYSKHEIGLQTVLPISFLGDIDVNAILTVNEGRKVAGLSEMDGEEGKRIIKQSKDTGNVQDKPVK